MDDLFDEAERSGRWFCLCGTLWFAPEELRAEGPRPLRGTGERMERTVALTLPDGIVEAGTAGRGLHLGADEAYELSRDEAIREVARSEGWNA